jgi:hypothetical protein
MQQIKVAGERFERGRRCKGLAGKQLKGSRETAQLGTVIAFNKKFSTIS